MWLCPSQHEGVASVLQQCHDECGYCSNECHSRELWLILTYPALHFPLHLFRGDQPVSITNPDSATAEGSSAAGVPAASSQSDATASVATSGAASGESSSARSTAEGVSGSMSASDGSTAKADSVGPSFDVVKSSSSSSSSESSVAVGSGEKGEQAGESDKSSAPPPTKKSDSGSNGGSSSRVLDLASELSKALGMKKRATHNAASGE